MSSVSRNEKIFITVIVAIFFLLVVIFSLESFFGTTPEKAEVRVDMPVIYSGVVTEMPDSVEEVFLYSSRILKVSAKISGITESYDVITSGIVSPPIRVGEKIFFGLRHITQYNYAGSGSPMTIDIGFLVREEKVRELIKKGATLVNE